MNKSGGEDLWKEIESVIKNENKIHIGDVYYTHSG